MCFILGYSRHSERRVTMKQDRPTLLEDFTWDVFKKRIIQYEIVPEKMIFVIHIVFEKQLVV